MNKINSIFDIRIWFYIFCISIRKLFLFYLFYWNKLYIMLYNNINNNNRFSTYKIIIKQNDESCYNRTY